MAVAAQVDNPSAFASCFYLGKEESGKKEVAKMIRDELRFDVVLVCGVIGDGHDASIVDHHMQLRDQTVDLSCGFANRVKVVELNRDKVGFDGRVQISNFRDDWCHFGLGASKEEQMRWVCIGEGDCCLVPYAPFAGSRNEDYDFC
jgi:hypothetical protein